MDAVTFQMQKNLHYKQDLDGYHQYFTLRNQLTITSSENWPSRFPDMENWMTPKLRGTPSYTWHMMQLENQARLLLCIITWQPEAFSSSSVPGSGQ